MTDPPTDKQVAVLEKYHHDIPATKEEATVIIGKLFGEKKEETPKTQSTLKVSDDMAGKIETPKFVGRTSSEKTDDNAEMLDINWNMAQRKAKEVLPVIVDENSEYIKQRLIITQVIFKALCYNWSKP